MEKLSIDNIDGYIQSVVTPGLKILADQKKEEKKPHRHLSTKRKEQKNLFGNELYSKAVHQYNEIQPHAEAEHFPAELFEKLSPHRRHDEFEWLRDNYESFSLPVFQDFMNTIRRGVNPNNYNIAWPETPKQYEMNSPKLYLTEELPNYTSIYTWFGNTFFDFKIKDANGVVSVKPLPSMFIENEEGEMVVNQDALFEPMPFLHHSANVIHFEENESLLVISGEKSYVEWAGEKKKVGWVLYFYDRNTIYRIEQYGKKEEYQFEVSIYFNHEWGYLPAWKVKGVPRIVNEQVYYQSPFYFAVGSLNAFLKSKMTLEMSTANTAYPYRVMVADECDFTHPETGQTCFHGSFIMEDGSKLNCPACNGTGLVDKPSAGGTMLVNEADVEGSASLDRIRFVSPDTAILTWLDQKCDKEKAAAREILHLRTTTDQASGGDDTATGRLIDHNSMYSFIRPIVEEGFDILDNILAAIVYMRYGNDVEYPIVNRPKEMFEKTSGEYLKDYKDAVSSGAPPIVIKRFMEKYVKSLFYTSAEEEKIWKLVLAVDTIATMPNEEVRQLKGSNVISTWQAILHVSIFQFIDELRREDEQFLDKEFTEQKEALIGKAKAAAAEAQAGSSRAALIEGI